MTPADNETLTPDPMGLDAAKAAVNALHERMAREQKMPGYSLILSEAISAYLNATRAPVASPPVSVLVERAAKISRPHLSDAAKSPHEVLVDELIAALTAADSQHTRDMMLLSEAVERADRATKERDEAHRIAKSITRALVRLTPGGSEYFTRSLMLDDYFADTEACERVVRERYDTGHSAKLEAVDLRRRISTIEARNAELEKVVGEFVAAEDDGAGLYDCVDNSGHRYQSQGLADSIRRARTTLSQGERAALAEGDKADE